MDSSFPAVGFATPVVVEHARRRDDGAEHDEFLVRFGEAQ